MNRDVARLARWLRRAQPPRAALAHALVAGVTSNVTNVAMFTGAVALLVESATRPGLRAVAGVLVVIELLAFVRAPLRFHERLRAHQLGFRAVSRWRHWLVATVGRWDYATWRSYAAGDLLERALRDTDELQDLWLRGVVPSVASVATSIVADVGVGLLPPHGAWWSDTALFVLVQLLGIVALYATFAPQVRADEALRHARGTYQASLVELAAITPELALLGAMEFVRERSRLSGDALARAERTRTRRRRGASSVAPLTTLATLAVFALVHPHSSPTWLVVGALVALATFETVATLRAALDTAVAISAAAERLEALETPGPSGTRTWPSDTTIRAHGLTLFQEATVVLTGATLEVAPGRRVALRGPSGSGKSTLLRALAGLDQCEYGTITIGEVPLASIDEGDLRRRLTYVPAEPGLTRGFARDVVALGRPSRRDATLDLACLDLAVDGATKFDELSRGERQRVALVRAMVSDPVIYLLDEPTSGLGRVETDAVLALLGATNSTFIVATHDERVMAWCDEVLELRDATLHVLNR